MCVARLQMASIVLEEMSVSNSRRMMIEKALLKSSCYISFSVFQSVWYQLRASTKHKVPRTR